MSVLVFLWVFSVRTFNFFVVCVCGCSVAEHATHRLAVCLLLVRDPAAGLSLREDVTDPPWRLVCLCARLDISSRQHRVCGQGS